MITISDEQAQDETQTREVTLHAFGRSLAGLVDRLRHDCKDVLSLVAVKQNRVVGHILFTPVVINNKARILLRFEPIQE